MMTIYFSTHNEGFYHSDSGVPVPQDAIEITAEQYSHFLTEMNHKNKKLVLEGDRLVLVDRAPDIDWNIIRVKRNKLLKDSDHKVMPDYPSDKVSWSTYRQALRDLPLTVDNPHNIVWPIKPSD